jgi:hypothetical protein
MATAADVMFAQLQQDEQNKILEQQRKQQSQLQKRRGRMGIGRLIGAAAGGLLGLATGGGSLLITGALAGLGSRAGSGIGGRVAVDDIEVGKLYQQQAQDARREGIQAQRDLIRSANVGALSDAFSAYTLAGTGLGKGLQQSIQTRSFNPLKQALRPGVFNTGSAGVSIDDLNQGVIDKYGQSMIQSRPGASILDTTKIAGPSRALASGNITPGSAQGIRGALQATESTSPLTSMSQTGSTMQMGPSTVPTSLASGNISTGRGKGIGNIFNAMQSEMPFGVTSDVNSFTDFIGPNPMGRYTGSAQQNMQLAQALGLNPNRSIVDQLKRQGGDSSMNYRSQLYSQLFGG